MPHKNRKNIYICLYESVAIQLKFNFSSETVSGYSILLYFICRAMGVPPVPWFMSQMEPIN